MVIFGKLKVGDIVQKISVSRGYSRRRHPKHTENDSKYEEAHGGYMDAIGIVTQIAIDYVKVKFDPLDDDPPEMFAYQLRKVGRIQ